MAKEFTVTLGGKTRRLTYTAQDAIALKKRFDKKIANLLREDVMGMEEIPKPGGKPGETQWLPASLYDLEVQIAFLHRGISTPDSRLPTEEQVAKWVDEEYIRARKPLSELIEPVWKAVFLSGVLGYTLDIEDEMEKAEAEGREEAPLEGNG